MNTPGLNGDLHGTCIVCFGPTDTALAFRGEPEWVMAGLMALGLPQSDSEKTVQSHYGDSFGRLPDPLSATIRVCSECADNATPNFPAPVLAIPGNEVPCIMQPAGDRGE